MRRHHLVGIARRHPVDEKLARPRSSSAPRRERVRLDVQRGGGRLYGWRDGCDAAPGRAGCMGGRNFCRVPGDRRLRRRRLVQAMRCVLARRLALGRSRRRNRGAGLPGLDGEIAMVRLARRQSLPRATAATKSAERRCWPLGIEKSFRRSIVPNRNATIPTLTPGLREPFHTITAAPR